MPGVKGKSGRKKLPSTSIKEALEALDADIPAIFQALKHNAVRELEITCPDCGHSFKIPGVGDKDSAIYLIDRRLGRPKQALDVSAKTMLFTADDYRLALEVAEAEERGLLAAGVVDGESRELPSAAAHDLSESTDEQPAGEAKSSVVDS